MKPGSDPRQAFRTIVRACVRHYRLNEALLIDHYDPQALHQARVAIRRLRSALTLFKPMLEAQQVVRFQDELRWLAQLMGEARDLDVLVEGVGQGDLHEQIEAVRDRVHADVLEALGSRRVRGLMIDVAEWLTLDAARESDSGSADAFAADRLQHVYQWVVKHGRHMTKLDDEHRHAVRKKAKKLRYASEFFAGLFSETKKGRKRHAHFIDALEALQDKLGALNDRVSRPELLKRHGFDMSKQPDAFGGKGRKKLIAGAAKAHADLADVATFWR
nr:CHAD domain-containing protein [Sphingobium vermicomposti]